MKKNNKRGGVREGAGRPKKELTVPTGLRITEQSFSLLKKASKGTGLSRNELADLIICNGLIGQDGDFVYCPDCCVQNVYLPIVSVNGVMSIKCPVCGHEYEYDNRY